ncbi:MAG: ROK family protein [Deltaproteobacteria bacterium]|nr:ROK family protein [Deltaproteobacteria bacterium]
MRIGIDLGGTKIEALAIDDEGRELGRQRRPTPRDSYESILDAVVALVGDVEAEVGAQGTVGLGIPGTISPATGLVKNANTTALIGHPLDRDLAARLGNRVRVANDANCFALSEAADGAGAPTSPRQPGQSPHVVFGVIIGTGTGGGVVVDGQILDGPDGIGGEWGHMPLPWPQEDEWPLPKCWCGRSGCVELFLSGTGLAADHKRVTGESLSGPEVAQAAAAGSAAALATMARYEHRLARGLAVIINVLNPQVIVLGGGVSNVERLYTNVPELWKPYAFSDVVSTRLVKAKHGDSSGVRGAAWLWPVGAAAELGLGAKR